MNNLLPVALLTLTCFAQDSDESRWTTRPIRGVVKLENGQPAIGFDVYVPGVGGEKLAVVKTSASGTFTLRVAPGVNMPTVFARSADGELMGSFDPFEQSRLLRITAKPKRTIQCTVLGVDGQPLAEADVGVVARYALVASGKSDADGKCVLEVPRDIAVELVFAKKDDHGFDYYENFTIYPTIIRQPPPESIKLKLEGATTCKVTLTDPNGQPVAGVPVAPWLIERVGKIDDANIGGCSNLSETTNKAGVAVFRWFPKDCERSIEFLVADRKLYIGRDLVATRRNDEIATTVYKRISVTGVVTHTDGSVAAGIELQAESRGGNYFRGYARTNSKGEYRFDIYPNQTTSIEVIDNRWGADAQSVTVAPGQPKADVNLSLLQGATLRGTISAEGGGNVDSGTHVTIISSGNVVRWEYVRPDGTYRARLGPGTYRVSLPGGQK
ncbi:MAG: carboxypeptidase-like regulatory domain-containing protein, partial [Planctomycetaceae bacterium]